MFEFTSKNRGSDRIVFLLTLDKKKKTERIIIGESAMVRLRIERNIGEVLYDEVRPLGHLLLNFESDPEKEWQLNASYLADNFAGLFPTKNVKRKSLKSYTDFLRQKYDSGEPSAMFAAVKTWQEYWLCFGEKGGSDIFLGRVAKLYKPFSVFSRLWETKATKVLSSALFAEESQVELWYSTKTRTVERGECVVTRSSMIPLIFYYLKRIEEWGLVFQKCKICGVHFLTTSKHFELCSDDCRKITAVQAKRQYDERNKGDKVEAIYENHYQYWYNRLRKLKRTRLSGQRSDVIFKVDNRLGLLAVSAVVRGDQLELFVEYANLRSADFKPHFAKQEPQCGGLCPTAGGLTNRTQNTPAKSNTDCSQCVQNCIYQSCLFRVETRETAHSEAEVKLVKHGKSEVIVRV